VKQLTLNTTPHVGLQVERPRLEIQGHLPNLRTS